MSNVGRSRDSYARYHEIKPDSIGLDPVIFPSNVLEQMAGSVAGHDGVDVCATSQSIGRLV